MGHIYLLLYQFYKVTDISFAIEIFLAVINGLFSDLVHVAAATLLLQYFVDLSYCHASVDASVDELLLVFQR